jgi:transcriptional regulator
MYQPAHRQFEVEDPPALLAELCAVVPATLVTHGPDGFRASILPMLFDRDEGPHGTLRGHLARGNPQWRDIETAIEAGGGGAGEALAIFDGPDSYVSPAWYEEKRLTGKVVPTWNYVTVQAHGTITTVHDPDWLIPHVGRLVARHEADRPDPWSLTDAPDDYVRTQARAIVGLELRIVRLEAKAKLSQNRSDADIRGTIEGLAAGLPKEQAVAARMRDLVPRAIVEPAEAASSGRREQDVPAEPRSTR